jgi:outer membrane lipoprotein-sorting protein
MCRDMQLPHIGVPAMLWTNGIPRSTGGVTMRCTVALAALILAAPAFAQQDAAEMLYRGMEKLVREAKSVKIAFESDAAIDKNTTKMSGVVSVADGNKARLEISGSDNGKPWSMTFIADGKMAHFTRSDMPKAESKTVEANLSQTRPQILARGGVFATFQIGQAKESFDIDKVMAVSDFKLGKKEKVGIREAQVVECTLKLDNGKVMQMAVWLDTQTNLPLKRLITAPGEKGVIRVTETYTEINLNPKFDDKFFEIPK